MKSRDQIVVEGCEESGSLPTRVVLFMPLANSASGSRCSQPSLRRQHLFVIPGLSGSPDIEGHNIVPDLSHGCQSNTTETHKHT